MRHITYFFSFFAVLGLLATFSNAQDTESAKPAAMDINAAIETYIKENPQVIIDSLRQYEIDQQERAEAEASAKLDTHKDYLLQGDLPRAGNPNGDIKIVEFYDYNCGYCKRALSDLQILLQDDENVQVTFVEMPILGENSLVSAKYSMAAANQDNFLDYHTAIMNFGGQKTKDTLVTLAQSSGIDVETMKANLDNPEILDQIEKNVKVAREIGINGTPGFIINGEIYRGYLGYDGLKAVIDEIRLSNAPAPAPEGEVKTDSAS